MDLKGIISISGKSGLFKVIGQGKNTLIVESLIDGKRFPAFTSNKISALDDITMFTTDEDIKLAEVVNKIYEKENGGKAVDPSKDAAELRKYFEQVVPNFDQERVFNSDLKKLFTWYDILQSSGTLKKLAEESAGDGKEEAPKTEENTERKPEILVAENTNIDNVTEEPKVKKASTIKKSSTKKSDTSDKPAAKKKTTVKKDTSK